MSVIERMKAPTPKFFKILRTVGIALVTAGGTLLATPIAVPAEVITIAGYAMVAGSVLSAVSQVAVVNDADRETKNETPMEK